MTTSNEAFEVWKRRASDTDILDVSTRIGAKLRKRSHEWIGPCPRCGGKDRFSIRPSKQVFNCRGAGGGDVIAMVMHACAVEFLAACEIITGEPSPGADTVITEETRRKAEELKAAAAEKQRRREHDDNLYRARERKTVFDIWDHAYPLEGSTAAEYLALRGLTFPPTPAGKSERLKCVEAMPYYLDRDTIVHRGPALVAPIVDSDRKFRGLHLTYLDLAQPKGKLQLQDPGEAPGELLDPKKSRGSVKGNYVVALGPAEDPAHLVLAEGMEKLIAVHMGLASTDRDLSSTAFWSACNLGNLGGGATGTVPHPTRRSENGRPERVAGAVPDLEAPAIAVPDSVTDLVLLGDTTSDPFTTRLALARATARYARPGRTVRVAWAPEGADFDDLLRDAKGNEQATSDALAKIASLVDAAGPIELPETPRSEDEPIKKSARRQPRSDQPSSSTRQTDPPASNPDVGKSESTPPPDPAAAAPPPSAAAGTVVDFPKRSSQMGVSAEKNPDGRTGAGRRATQRRGGKGNDGDREDSDAALDRRLAFFPMTDLGNAERFRERNRDFLKWCPAIGWLWWDGKRWKKDGADGQVKIAEHRTVRSIQDEADSIVDTPADVFIGEKGKKGQEEKVFLSDLLRSWGRSSEANSKITPIATNAAAYLEVEPDDLDADPFMVNIANGTLVIRRDWSTEAIGKDWPRYNDYIRLKPHDPRDLITKISPAALDANAPRVRFDTFLVEVQPDSAMRRFLQAWKGYGLTGDIGEHRMVMFIGAGRNGKSVLEDVTAHVQGDYAETVPIETFLATGREVNANSPTPARALLHGARAVRTSEPPKTANLDEGFIKLVTGGEPIQARNLNRSFMRFYPRFKLSISLNHEIKIGGTDEGIWSRVTKVPWPIIIAKEKRDRDLAHKLRNEASGILSWMLDGLTDWLEHGLVIPEQVRAATEEYRRNSDQLGRFLEACTLPTAGARAQSSVLHAVFNAWSRVSGGSEWSNKGLSNALHDRGYKSKQSDVMWWLDLELTKAVNDFVDHEGKPLTHTDITSPRPGRAEETALNEQF